MALSTADARIIAMETYDIRFPTSQYLDGSDAMNPDPDYSAAYVVLRTGEGLSGHGFAFTIGRGNDIQTTAIEVLRPYVVGRSVAEVCADPGSVYRTLLADSQLRWLGPEKGVMHMAIGAVVNAVWDLAAKRAGKPLWRLLSEAEPEWIVGQADFRYVTDALTPEEALRLLESAREGAADRADALVRLGYPAYSTTAGSAIRRSKRPCECWFAWRRPIESSIRWPFAQWRPARFGMHRIKANSLPAHRTRSARRSKSLPDARRLA